MCVQNKGEPAGEGKDHTTEMGAAAGTVKTNEPVGEKKKSQTRERGWKLRGRGKTSLGLGRWECGSGEPRRPVGSSAAT